MEILDNFAVFEGVDGSGTSTQLALLKDKFAAHLSKKPFFYPTFEPTDGVIGRLIRSALKNTPPLKAETLARLFAADRNEHLFADGGIVERCRRGELVVCDRYVLSSLAYQGIECGRELPAALNSAFPAPELLLLFDIDPSVSEERLRGRPSADIYEHLEFQKKVREQYLSLPDGYRNAGVRVEIIDAAQSVEKVAEQVWRALSKRPIFTKEKREERKEKSEE
jgi:dTMP kinase